MNLGLSGTPALVTGSTSGIGFAIAAQLAEEGAHVILNGRTDERLQAARQRLMQLTPTANVLTVAADLGTPTGRAALFAAVPDVGVLVANAGTFDVTPFPALEDSHWTQAFAVNLLGPAAVARNYLEKMISARTGRIVFVSSEAAFEPAPDLLPYSAMKAGLLAVASGMAQLTARTHVTVNTVVPGPTATEGHATLMSTLAEAAGRQSLSATEFEEHFFAELRPTSLLGRFATPAEVASAVAYLCSIHASATNGATLRTDGGAMRLLF